MLTPNFRLGRAGRATTGLIVAAVAAGGTVAVSGAAESPPPRPDEAQETTKRRAESLYTLFRQGPPSDLRTAARAEASLPRGSEAITSLTRSRRIGSAEVHAVAAQDVVCLHVRSMDMPGSASGCSLLADSRLADEPLTLVRKLDGARWEVTALAPDKVDAMTVVTGAGSSQHAVRDSVVSTVVDSVPAELRWTKTDGTTGAGPGWSKTP